MTDLKKAAQQALEALTAVTTRTCAGTDGMDITPINDAFDMADTAITALKAALEQPEQEQEPVAWRFQSPLSEEGQWEYGKEPPVGSRWAVEPLYTHPSRRKPLSNEELDRLWREPMSADWEHREYARAIEAALKEENHE